MSDPTAPDPYLEWARSQGPITDPRQIDPGPPAPLEQLYPHVDSMPPPLPGAPAATAPQPPPTTPGLVPGLGIPQSVVDPYLQWAPPPSVTGPVTAPSQAPSAGAAPLAPQAGPVTSPGDVAPSTQPLGGNVDPNERAAAIAKMSPADQAAAVDSMSPDEFARYQAQRNRSLILRQSELEHNAATESEQRAREDLAMQRAAVAKADADTRDLVQRADVVARTKIDPDQLVHSLGVGGSIAMLFATTLGGAMSQYTGGRNLALEQFNKRVENSIAAQHADLANQWKGIDVRKGAIASEYAQHNDIYKAQETYRVASYQAALANMQSELQQYDQAGGTAAFLRSQMDTFHAAQAQTINAYGQQQLKNNLEIMKEDRDKAAQIEVARHNKAEESVAWAKEANAARAAKQQAQVFTPEQLGALMPAGSPIPKLPMDQKTYGEWLDNTKKGQEASLGGREFAIGGVAKAQRDADGNVLGVTYKPLLNKDGKEFVAPSKTEAEKLRTQKAGVDLVNGFVDEMVSGIKEHGGASAFFKSPEWQTMQANKESLLFALHAAYGVEGFRPGVLEQMEKALGGQDPAKITVLSHDAIPGLQAAKKAVNAHFDANLRAQNYTGEEYSPESAIGGDPLPKLSGRTAEESQPGPLDKQVTGLRDAGRALMYPLESNPQLGTERDTGPAVGPTGLSPEDTAKVQEMVQRYNKGTPLTREKVIAALTAPLAAGRPSLNTGILGLIRDDSPELYKQVLQVLPPEQQQQETLYQAARAKLPKVP